MTRAPWSNAQSTPTAYSAAPSSLELADAPWISDHANDALFLVSDEARWVSGQLISTVDGANENNAAIDFGDDWVEHLTGGETDS